MKKLEPLLSGLTECFSPKDMEFSSINELTDMKLRSGESIKCFLNKAKSISLKGGVSDKVLSKDLANRLMMYGRSHAKGLCWEAIYDACSNLEVTKHISATPLFTKSVASSRRCSRPRQQPRDVRTK